MSARCYIVNFFLMYGYRPCFSSSLLRTHPSLFAYPIAQDRLDAGEYGNRLRYTLVLVLTAKGRGLHWDLTPPPLLARPRKHAVEFG